jgi:DNA-binding NtrC family response regulator
VRELSNVLERALLMSDADSLEQEDFEQILPAWQTAGRPGPLATHTLEEVQQDAEREAILAAIAAASGNKAQAARNLGISRASSTTSRALGIASDNSRRLSACTDTLSGAGRTRRQKKTL